jgi:5-methylcytosine-specific restriction endonuclease McrA
VKNAKPRTEAPESAARHCLLDPPYRMVVFVRTDGNGTPLYQVPGSPAGPMGAKKALRQAFEIHGGRCFYCTKTPALADLTIDHAQPAAAGGRDDIQNLLIACRPCNQAKGGKPIELFKREGGREWLSALLAQIQDRLNRI